MTPDLPTSPAKDVAATFDGRVPFPSQVAIETTMYCNLRCPMCFQYQNGTTVTGPHMKVADFEAVAHALFPYVDSFLPSVSGEPLMSKGFDKMLALAESYGVRAEYYSNGTLLKEKMARMILPTLGRLQISFDGVTKETFEFLREGAVFEKVVENVEAMVRLLETLPPEERPEIGFVCTLMERNVRELPELVELAHRLGLDFLFCHHMSPSTQGMQEQSLVHHKALAADCIERARRRAVELGLPFSVAPLDQVREAMAAAEDPGNVEHRAIASEHGLVAGLEGCSVNQDKLKDWASLPVDSPEAATHRERRADLRARRDLLGEGGADDSQLPDSIYTCEFLWKRPYIGQYGDVHACCVPGTPYLGNLRTKSFEAIWDSDVCRSLRHSLVAKEPAPVCRGCQHAVEINDPGEIRRLLQGRPLPAEGPGPLHPALRALADGPLERANPEGSPVVHSAPPVLEWEACEGAEGYEFEAAFDDFDNIEFNTTRFDMPLRAPRFDMPEWVFLQIPPGRTVNWRAVAILPEERRVVVRGELQRTQG